MGMNKRIYLSEAEFDEIRDGDVWVIARALRNRADLDSGGFVWAGREYLPRDAEPFALSLVRNFLRGSFSDRQRKATIRLSYQLDELEARA